MRKIEAHPDAAIFPMMSADDLANLAADIKAHGLVHPIVIGKIEVADGKTKEVIVDGRNRYEACEIAGVEPRFAELNGHDPKAFILSSNIARRHMTAGQRAMAYARIYPTQGTRGRGNKIPKFGEFTGVTSQRVADARLILEWAPDLVDNVQNGSTIISEGVKEAKKRADAASTEEAKLDQLRNAAPDLADLVAEARMKLDEATAAAKERADSLIRQRKLVAEEMARTLDFFVQDNLDAETRAEQIAALFDVTQATAEMKQMSETLALLISHAQRGGTHGE
ncbi:hypothetical protein ACVWXQ_003019 [Bradyrhizobium sp. S3.14.4]|uniref:ParB/RepB/Spo0J family partition protein n=1 Tax=unclassified Bradyrhizobium TaxID=2631580 RepID=UPI0033982A11